MIRSRKIAAAPIHTRRLPKNTAGPRGSCGRTTSNGNWTSGKVSRSRSAHCLRTSADIVIIISQRAATNRDHRESAKSHGAQGMAPPSGRPSQNQKTAASSLTPSQGGM